MSENFGNYFFKDVKNTIGQENQNKPLTQFAKGCILISVIKLKTEDMYLAYIENVIHRILRHSFL